jgi:hypothetical protein
MQDGTWTGGELIALILAAYCEHQREKQYYAIL